MYVLFSDFRAMFEASLAAEQGTALCCATATKGWQRLKARHSPVASSKALEESDLERKGTTTRVQEREEYIKTVRVLPYSSLTAV